MNPPQRGEGDHPQGGGGGAEQAPAPPSSAADATATSPSRGGSTRIPLAAVAGAHGVKGELRLKLFGDGAGSLAAQQTAFLGGVERRILSVREGGKTAVARIEGVNDRNGAEALRGSLIEIDREALPPLAEGEYYHADLIGLPCFDQDGQAMGTIIAVENYGAGDILEIEAPSGKRQMIPFRDGVADLQDGRIILDPDFLA